MPIPPQVGSILESVIRELVSKALTDRFRKFLKDRETRADLEEAWGKAREKMLAENPAFDSLVDQGQLLKTVLEHALDPYWLRSPGAEELANAASLRWITDPRAEQAARAFLKHFITVWKLSKSFSMQALLFEEIGQTEILDAIRAAIVGALKEGVKTSAAGRPGPSPTLLLEYCKRLQAMALAAFPYERTVTRKRPVGAEVAPADSIPLGKALKENERLLLVGEGGLGKSMALRGREQELAGKCATGENAPVPVLLRLVAYGGETIERLIADRVNGVLTGSGLHLSETAEESERAARTWLEQQPGGVEILFDGLNEIPEDLSATFLTRLESFQLYKQRFVFTAREAGIEARGNSGIVAFVLNPLELADVSEIVSSRLPGPGAELREHLDSDPDFALLLRNPFFLELVLQLPAASSQAGLPENRALLLREYVRSVPQAIRNEVQASPGAAGRTGVVEAFLTQLGWRMLGAGVTGAAWADVYAWNLPLSGFSLDDVLLGASTLRHLRSRGSDGELIEFRHQILRDYFAAERIAAAFRVNRDFAHATESHYAEPAWIDAIRMTAGLVGADSIPLVQWLMANDSLDLAFECWTSSAARHDAALTSQLAATLRASVTPDLLDYADPVVIQLGVLRDPAAVPLIREFMRQVGRWAHYVAIAALEKIGTSEACKVLAEALASNDEDTRKAAAAALRRIGRPAVDSLLLSPTGAAENILRDLAPSIVPELRQGAGDAEHEVRARAVHALGFSRSPEAAGILIPLLGTNEHNLVRTRAATALGELRDSAAISTLTEVVQREDENPGVKFEAAASLWRQGWALDNARAALLALHREQGRYPIWKIQVLNCLLTRPDAAIIAMLFAACRDTDDEVRRNAYLELGDLEEKTEAAALDELLELGLRDAVHGINMSAAGVLFARYSLQALPRITRAFEEDPVKRRGLLEVIDPQYGKAGREYLHEVVRTALNEKVRETAENSLLSFPAESAATS